MPKPAISRFLLATTLLVSISAALGVGALWIMQDVRRHDHWAAELREQLLNQKKVELQAQVRQASQFIDTQRQTIETRLSDSIKDRVYEAHALASNLYDFFAEKSEKHKIEAVIRDMLGRIRFHNGRGYIFALDMQGAPQVNNFRPHNDAATPDLPHDGNGDMIVQRILELASTQQEGFVSYNWAPSSDAFIQKISYVKYFAPLDWVIGAGDYVKHVEEDVQRDILARLENIRFGESGQLFVSVVGGDFLIGAPVMHPGRLEHLEPAGDETNGVNGGPSILDQFANLNKTGEGFSQYTLPASDERPAQSRLSYADAVRDWGWRLGASVSLADVDAAVAELESQLQAEIERTIITVLLLVSAMAGGLYVLFKSMAVQVDRDISSLVDFIQHDQNLIAERPPVDMRFRETAAIANAAREVLISCMAGDAALQNSEERFKLAMEASSDGLWDWNVELGDVYYSPAYGAMLGFSPEEMDHSLEYWTDRLHPEDKPRVIKANTDCIEGRSSSFQVEFRMLAKHGHWVWVLGRGKAVSRGEDGRALRMVGTHTDITARKKAEAALKEAKDVLEAQVLERTKALAQQAAELEVANQELQKSASMKTNLMTMVSHELRTPLTSIYGFVKLIRKDFSKRIREACKENPQLESRCQRIDANLEIIEAEGQRLGRIINDFLDLSKIEAGRMAWNDADVSPAGLMERAARLVAPNFEAKDGVKLEVKPPAEAPLLHIDEDRLVQVLVNLLDNACKHTEKGRVTLSALPFKEMVRFTVADTGKGIPQEDLEQVFETFYQSPSAHASGQVAKGTGLGLSICRQIVKHYGGRIWAESPPGEGALFHVEIPVTASHQESSSIFGKAGGQTLQ